MTAAIPTRTWRSRSGSSSLERSVVLSYSLRPPFIRRAGGRARRGHARSGREHPRFTPALRSCPSAPGCSMRCRSTGVGDLRSGLFRQYVGSRCRQARRTKHEFMVRVFDAAVLLGVNAVCGFVAGATSNLEMDANLQSCSRKRSFHCCARQRRGGSMYRVEQCPMPGWTTLDRWHNNLAYAPGPWIALHRICERHGVGDQFRIHYDPSHAILMGQDSRSLFQYLKDEDDGFSHRRLSREGAGHR